jgi:hypothetical protein
MFEIRAMQAPWRRGIEFMATDDNLIGRKIEFDLPVNNGISIEPTFSLSMQQAQTLMDDLWNCGLRPTEGTGSAGALKAVERHLDDMRKIVSKKLEVNL